jgi:general secretion pathway protein D
MIRRCACLALIALALAGSAALARPEPAPSPYAFAFKDADLADAAEAILGRTLNLTYAIDPDVTGKVSFRIDRRLTPSQLLEAFEATLALQDIAVVRSGATLLLEKRAKARASSSVQTLEQGRHAIGYQTLAVPLAGAAPADVAKALQAMGQGGVISYVDEAQNQIVLAGAAQEVETAVKAIRLFDRGAQGGKVRFFALKSASPAAVAQEAQGLMRAARTEGVSIVPVKRLNGVYAFARTEAALDQVATWIAKLDVAGEDRNGSLFLYHPMNASAEGLKAALSSITGGGDSSEQRGSDSRDGGDRLSPGDRPLGAPRASPSTSTAAGGRSTSRSDAGDTGGGIGLLGESVRIGIDKDTNTLLVAASPAQWAELQKLLAELDRTPGQVLIEASILEVTLSKDNRFGVDFSVIGAHGRVTATSSANGAGAVAATFPGFAVTYADTNLKAAVQALGSTSRVEVISAPKIMALDNKTATIDVGDQVPVVSQSAQSTASTNAPLVNTVDYRNTGVILKVTPRITGGDAVLLDISQEVSSVAATTTSGIDSPTILQRRMESALVLNDGAVVALGGMISANRSRDDTGIPFLKDAPVLGALFRTRANDETRTELVVLLSAHIIRDRAGAERAMTRLKSEMQALKGHDPLQP